MKQDMPGTGVKNNGEHTNQSARAPLNTQQPQLSCEQLSNGAASRSIITAARYLVDGIVKSNSELLLGRKLLNGVVLTFASGRPEIHVNPVPINEMLQSLATNPDEICKALKQFGSLHGTTPSYKAFRAMSIVLRRSGELTSSDQKSWKDLQTEALAIDLKNPGENRAWKSQINITLQGIPTTVSVTIKPFSQIAQLTGAVLGGDIPHEDRNNRYAFEIKLSRIKEPRSWFSHKLDQISSTIVSVGRQVTAVGFATIGMMPVFFGLKAAPIVPIAKAVGIPPELFGSIGDLHSVSALIATGYIGFLTHQYFRARQLENKV